jgi:hypothetical protein
VPEDKNIEEGPKDGKPERPEEVSGIILPPRISSTENNQQLTTHNLPLTTKEMEVHHHPQLKHERKPWKEYFLEYLMIVLAVTTGFFAESLREHLGDTSKEHAYITSLKKDLITDTLNLSTWILAFNSRINEYDTVINLMRHPENITDGADLYYRARMTTRGTVFDDNNNTITQLNISGNFRLISNKATAEKIVAYETDIDNYKNVNSYDAYEARALYEPQSEIFDAFVFNDMSRPITDSSTGGSNTLVTGFRKVFEKPTGNPQLIMQDKEKINEFAYYLHQRRSTFSAEILILYKQKEDAKELIAVIDKEYHLKDE